MKPNPQEIKTVKSVVWFYSKIAVVILFVGLFIFATKNPTEHTSLLYVSHNNKVVPFTKFESNPVPLFNNAPGRTLNAAYQSIAGRGTLCTYTVTITTALSLLNDNSSGKAYLEISPDNTTWTTINSAGITQSLAVSITVGLNESVDYNLQGSFPKGWYCRIRTVVSGGSTITMTSGQEVMF